MKKFKFIAAALFTLVLATSVTSCKNEVDDIFGKNAAERMSEAIDNYTDLLKAEGGLWAMEYFSNSTTPGFILIMKFEQNGDVTISGNYLSETADEVQSATSQWQVIGDNGPVLSFDTYNEVLHFFSDPSYSPRGRGFEGDYEFNLMKYQNDTLYVNGKKHGADLVMYRLPQSTDINQYFADLFRMQLKTVTSFFPVHRMIGSNGLEYVLSGMGDQYVTFFPRLGDEISQSVDGNAIITLDGFYFQNPVDLIDPDGGHTLKVQHFKLQDDGSFLCTDDGVSRILAMDFPYLLEDRLYMWRIDPTACGGAFAETYEAMAAESLTKNNRRVLSFVDYVYESTMYESVMQFKTGTRTCNFVVDSITFNGENKARFNFNHDKDNNNAKQLMALLPTVQTWFGLLDDTFTMSSEEAYNAYRVRFTSDKNSANYFTLYIYKRNVEEGSGDVN